MRGDIEIVERTKGGAVHIACECKNSGTYTNRGRGNIRRFTRIGEGSKLGGVHNSVEGQN